MTRPAFSALILAGSRCAADPVAEAERVSHKALVNVAGTTLIERVHGALIEAGAEKVFVSADNPQVVALAISLGATVIPPGAGPSASVADVFSQSGAPLLVTTADHALLKPEWVREVVEGANECDIAVMLARRDKVELAVSGTRRTWWRFADGQWSGCNIFYLRTERASRAIDSWREVDANRKRPWRIAIKLGLPTLLSYALGRLRLAEAIERLGHSMGCDACLVPACDGLAAIDVDKPSDLVDVRRINERLVHAG